MWVLTRATRWFLQEPHGVTSQKTPFLIVTAMKTSNLTSQHFLRGINKSDVSLFPLEDVNRYSV
jgi:hypothetical protein